MWIVTEKVDWLDWLYKNIGQGCHISYVCDTIHTKNITFTYTQIDAGWVVIPKYDENPMWRVFRDRFERKSHGKEN